MTLCRYTNRIDDNADAALQVTDVIYDAQQDCAVVYTMQHLTPKLLPFLTFQFPLITKLKFSSGKNKVHLFTCWHGSY